MIGRTIGEHAVRKQPAARIGPDAVHLDHFQERVGRDGGDGRDVGLGEGEINKPIVGCCRRYIRATNQGGISQVGTSGEAQIAQSRKVQLDALEIPVIG